MVNKIVARKMYNYINDYVAIDLEMTGVDAGKDKIIEIGAIRVREGKETDIFTSFVNPGMKLEERIINLTGIQEDDLKDAPYIETVLPDLLDFIGEDIILGHGIIHDYSFIKRAAVYNKLEFEKEGIDTLKIARRFLTSLPGRSLGELCSHYAIPHKAHRAYEDARATSLLYKCLVDEFYSQETAEIFAPYKLIYKVKKQGPITKAQLERLSRMLEEKNLVLDRDIKRLTKNEASRIMDYIRSEGHI